MLLGQPLSRLRAQVQAAIDEMAKNENEREAKNENEKDEVGKKMPALLRFFLGCQSIPPLSPRASCFLFLVLAVSLWCDKY